MKRLGLFLFAFVLVGAGSAEAAKMVPVGKKYKGFSHVWVKGTFDYRETPPRNPYPGQMDRFPEAKSIGIFIKFKSPKPALSKSMKRRGYRIVGPRKIKTQEVSDYRFKCVDSSREISIGSTVDSSQYPYPDEKIYREYFGQVGLPKGHHALVVIDQVWDFEVDLVPVRNLYDSCWKGKKIPLDIRESIVYRKYKKKR